MAFGSEPDIKLAIAAFFSKLIDCVACDNGPGGCLIANVATERAIEDPQVRHKVAGMISNSERFIADRVSAAQNDGQLSARIDPQALACMMVSVMHCLALRARLGASRKELARLAKNFTAVLVPA